MPNEPTPHADKPHDWQAWCECCDDPASERRLFRARLPLQGNAYIFGGTTDAAGINSMAASITSKLYSWPQKSQFT